MISDLPPPILVEDERGLRGLVRDLESQSEIAVDTEADSFFSYREKVCLIQVSVEDRDYLVDPLQDGLDIRPLGDVLADPARIKVFHDGEYDILSLKRDYGFRIGGLFDTRVAAAALGAESPGLATVLREHFDVELDKSMQRSNWAQRPLSEKQVAYARLDTRFLIPLMHRQQKELATAGRARIVEGECRRLELLEPPATQFDADEFARVKGARHLTPAQRQVMREVFALRERIAEKRDVPPFRVMGPKTLVAIAKARPRNKNELGEVEGFSWKQVRQLGGEVLAAVQRAKELGPLRKMPSLPSRDGTGGLDEQQLELHERLKAWRRDRARDEGIDSSLVLNRHVLLRLAQARPRDLAQLAEIDGLLDWQRETLGEGLLGVVADFERDVKNGALMNGRRRRRG